MKIEDKTSSGSLALAYTIRAVLWGLLALVCLMPLASLFYGIATGADVKLPPYMIVPLVIGLVFPIFVSVYSIIEAGSNAVKANEVLRSLT